MTLPLAVADQVYVHRAGLRPLKLDLCRPAHRRPVPLLFWIHGGVWLHDDKDKPLVPRQLHDEWALASIQYHFSPKARFPAQIHACKAAVRWLQAHAAAHNLNTRPYRGPGGVSR